MTPILQLRQWRDRLAVQGRWIARLAQANAALVAELDAELDGESGGESEGESEGESDGETIDSPKSATQVDLLRSVPAGPRAWSVQDLIGHCIDQGWATTAATAHRPLLVRTAVAKLAHRGEFVPGPAVPSASGRGSRARTWIRVAPESTSSPVPAAPPPPPVVAAPRPPRARTSEVRSPANASSRAAGASQAVREFLAAGGQVRRLPGTGSAELQAMNLPVPKGVQ